MVEHVRVPQMPSIPNFAVAKGLVANFKTGSSWSEHPVMKKKRSL